MDDKIKFISAPYRVDRKLYKYYSNIGFAIDCIKRHRVHLDNPHNFNDPFEAKWGFSYYSLLETVKPADSIFDEIFEYNGSQINPSWAFQEFGIYGSSIITWIGPVNITPVNLKDFADVGLEIKSNYMVNFICEFCNTK